MFKKKTWLDEMIEKEVEAINESASPTEERSQRLEDLDKMMRMKAEEGKSKRGMLETGAKLVLEGVGIGAPLIFYNVWMKRGFQFEETGTFTSQTFKGLINKFKPTGI